MRFAAYYYVQDETRGHNGLADGVPGNVAKYATSFDACCWAAAREFCAEHGLFLDGQIIEEGPLDDFLDFAG